MMSHTRPGLSSRRASTPGMGLLSTPEMSFAPTPLPPRPTTVYGFAEMDVLSPADVLRRHLNVFSHATTGHLPSLKQKRLHKLTERGEDAPYRAADMVGIDRAHRLTPSRSSPSRRHISSIMVLYTHDSRFLQAQQSTKKVTVTDLEPLASRTGFVTRELLRFLKLFQKLVNPTTKGVDQIGFTEFLNKMVGLDPTDDILCKRLFEAASRPNPKMGTLSQASLVVELLQILKKGDTLAKAGYLSSAAAVFYRVVDTQGSGWVSLSDIDAIFRTKERLAGAQLDIVKERRKMTVKKIMDSVYTVLDKNKDGRISREELLNAVCLHQDVTRFFDRIGYLIIPR